MVDVFISYSRKDLAFAQQLFSQFQQTGRDVWVDWDDIPLTADWWAEICTGIEAADAFVFVISPASIASPICNLEIHHARQQNKRLIPIIRARADEKIFLAELAAAPLDDNVRARLRGQDMVTLARENWQALTLYNWIFFDNDADFEQSYQNLENAINTDLQFVRDHTRLLVRAHEWDRNGRNNSFLLRGEDLSAAENWLAASGDKEPAASDLHQQYIFTSRRVERANRRRLLAGITSALVVAFVLTVAAFLAFQNAEFERLRANNNAATSEANAKIAMTNDAVAFAESTRAAEERDRANLQAQIAVSRRLAEQARNFRGEHLDLALLLGIEGMMRYDERDTQSALLEVLHTAPQLQRYLRGHSAPITALAVSVDGRVIASGDDDGQVHFWDASTGQRIGLGLDVIFAVNALRFNDQNQIAIGTADGALAVWDFNSGELVQPLRETKPFTALMLGSGEEQAEFSADGKVLVTASFDGTISVWDAQTGELVDEISIGTGIFGDEQVDQIALSPTASLVAIRSFSLGESDAGTRIVLWNRTNDTQEVITTDGIIEGTLGFSPDDSTLAFVEREQIQLRLRLLDIATGTVKLSLATEFDANHIGFSQDSRRVFLTSSQGDVAVIDITSGEWLLPATRGHNAEVSILSLVADGRHFVTGSADTRVAVWALDTHSPIARPLAVDAAGGIILFNHDGRLVALANNQTIEIRQVENGDIFTQPFNAHNDTIAIMLFHPTKNILASMSGEQIKIWDVDRSEAELLYTLEHPSLASMAFSPDGRLFVTGSLDGNLKLWDAADGDLLSEPNLRFGGSILDNLGASPSIQSVMFSPDGQILATNHQQAIYLWQMQGDEVMADEPLLTLQSPTGETTIFLSAQYSPDGRLIAAGNHDGSIFVWRTDTGQLALPLLIDHESMVWELSFDPTSRILASATYTDGLRLWDLSSGDNLGGALGGDIFSIHFSPVLAQGGPVLASTGAQGPSLWPLNAQAMRSAACRRSGLLMSEADWQTYFGDVPYRHTCPEVALVQADYLTLNGETEAAADLLAQAINSAAEFQDGTLANALCRYGALDALYVAALPACDQAVMLEPGNGLYYDSRGLARALNGDMDGAIDDFTIAVEWSSDNGLYETFGIQREAWLAALRAGENPFDLETRIALRAESSASVPYPITIAATVPLLPSELPPPPQPMTAERLAEKIAEAALPYEPIIPVNIYAGFSDWILDGAGRIDRSALDANAINTIAPGPDTFAMRLIPVEGEGLIAVFQSNGPHTNLREWSNAAPGIFAVLSIGAQADETLTLQGIEVRKFILDDRANYFFVLEGLQFNIHASIPPAEPALVESLVEAFITAAG